MPTFESLLEDSTATKPMFELPVLQPKKAAKPKKGLGCENCELNNKETKKFITKVRGRKLMLIGSNPTDEDEEVGKIFKSTASKFLWRELAKVGITREDCDLQLALRCNPGFNAYIGNKKFKKPIRCCSEHTEKALSQSKAKVYVIFGIEAARQVLGKEYRVGTTILWSEKLNAKVYCLWNPSYYIRSNVKAKALKEFRKNLALIAVDLKRKTLSKYQYLDAQDYQGIVTGVDARKEVAFIKKNVLNYNRMHNKPLRVYCDEEAGKTPENEWFSLCVGTCIKPGRVRVFVVSPLLVKSLRERKEIRLALKDLLEDEEIEKAFHHGSYDVPAIERNLDIATTNFHFDTNYSSYLYNTDLQKYGLDNVGLKYFPEFGEYKTIILPEALPKDFDFKATKTTNATPTQLHDYISARGKMNLAQLPLWKLVKYNAVDCDLGKRLELKTSKTISLPLLSIYTDCGFVLDEMVPNGPTFDYKQYNKLAKIIPPRIEFLLKKLRKWAKDKKFNPGSHPQVAKMLFDTLKLKAPAQTNKERRAQKSTRSAGKGVLELLGRKHVAPRLLAEFRRLKKMMSTYLVGFSVCANNNLGKLRTKWWLTGTRTGRLSSGGGKAKDLQTSVVNLQNVHGDQNLQNMLVADPKWRKLYLAIKESVTDVLGEFELAKLKKLGLDKDKKDEYYKFSEHCFSKLSKSNKFKKACDKIIKRYGNVKIVLGFDQGQVEVRVMAQASGDKNLIRDCMSGDIHSKVGHRMTGWAVEKIKKDKKTRTLTKNIHFGILFGLGANGLMSFILNKDPDSDITEAKAIELWEAYFKAYPGVRRFIEKMRKLVEDTGKVSNMFGFERPLGNDDKYSEDEDTTGGAFWGNQAINCVDFETEALTQRGWVKGYDLKKGDVLLTMNPKTKEMEWQSATDVKVFPDYEGPVHHLSSKSFSAVTTADHRWLIEQQGKLYERTSKSLPNSGHIHRVGNYVGPSQSKYTDDFIRLVGWVLTDGSLGRRYKDIGQGKATTLSGWAANGMYVCQSKPKNIPVLDALFARLNRDMGLQYRTKKLKNRRTHDEIFWRFSGTFGRWFKGMFPTRELTADFLTQLTKEQLQILRKTMWKGDAGTCRSKSGIDAWQMLCALCDKASTVRYKDMSDYIPRSDKMENIPKSKGCWYLKQLKRTRVSLGWVERKVKKEKIGMWCPMVPNTFFLARRNGSIYITGNTPIQGAAHQLMLMAMTKLKDKASKYRIILGVPGMEVHDAIYWWTPLKNFLKARTMGKQLLEKEPLRVVKKLYPEIDWKIPLVVEGKAGLRLGDTVEIEDAGKELEMHEVLARMFIESFKSESDINNQLKKVA